MGWVLLLPFLMYLWPYVALRLGDREGTSIGVLTVDEPIYIASARDIAEGVDARRNAWTGETGSDPSPYRVVPGPCLPLAAWMRLGGDITVGLGVIAGACAAALSGLTFLGIRCLGRGASSTPVAAALAPLSVLMPWERPQDVLIGRWLQADPMALLPYLRPFTSQLGPLAFLTVLWAWGRVRRLGRARDIALFAGASLLTVHVYPYAVPAALGAAAVGLAVEGLRGDRWLVGLAALVLASAAALPSMIRLLSLDLPWTAEIEPRVLGLSLVSKRAVAILCVGAVGLFALRRVRGGSFARAIAAAGIVIGFGMASDAVLPYHLQGGPHLSYLYPAVVGLLVLGAGVALLSVWLPRRGHYLAIALALCGTVGSVIASREAFARAEPDNRALREAVPALRRAGALGGDILLLDGFGLNSLGGWAPLFVDTPVLYAYDAEHAPAESLDSRQERRAWYLHYVGQDAADLPARSDENVFWQKRIAGALVYTPRPDVVTSIARRMQAAERSNDAAGRWIRRFASITSIERESGQRFRSDRLAVDFTLVRSIEDGPWRIRSWVRRR